MTQHNSCHERLHATVSHEMYMHRGRSFGIVSRKGYHLFYRRFHVVHLRSA
jgi:hypothetical protein